MIMGYLGSQEYPALQSHDAGVKTVHLLPPSGHDQLQLDLPENFQNVGIGW